MTARTARTIRGRGNPGSGQSGALQNVSRGGHVPSGASRTTGNVTVPQPEPVVQTASGARDLTLSEALAALGCSHRESARFQRRDVYRGDEFVGAMTASEGWEFVRSMTARTDGAGRRGA